LPITDVSELHQLSDILELRRSEREFEDVPVASLAALLWRGARTKASDVSSMGVSIEHRLAPSAGAIHPIHLIIQLPKENGWARYNPHAHCLDVLSDASRCLDPLVEHCESVLSRQDGSLILFVAEPGKTSEKYENSESLVWRDAGVLQGCLGLIAASLTLNYCLLGITGNPWVAALSDQGELQGVGMAILGARP
jgi:SagB-type dehydrogenase family enzyme